MMLELGSGSNLRLVEWYSILAILHNRKEKKPIPCMYSKKAGRQGWEPIHKK